MEVKTILYVIFTFISAIGISGINFNGLMKKNRNIEATILILVLSFALGYLLTNFVIDFLNI